MTLVDTAELHADGAAEELVGEAIGGRRDAVFIVDKVFPDHATVEGTVTACRGSLRRLRTDRINLYLLHWRGPVSLSQTLEAFAQLRAAGAIRYWGVGNFDVPDLAELVRLPGGRGLAADQVPTARCAAGSITTSCRGASRRASRRGPRRDGRTRASDRVRGAGQTARRGLTGGARGLRPEVDPGH